MRAWILLIVTTTIGLTVQEKDNRPRTPSDRKIQIEENDIQCWNTYFNTKCFSDYFLDQPERSFRNRFFGYDSTSAADDNTDDPKKADTDNVAMMSKDIQFSDKRSVKTVNSDCDCQVQNDVKDLGQMHYPRYIITAMCQDDRQKNMQLRYYRHGSKCKPVEYIVNVLTPRLDSDSHDNLLPDSLRPFWKFDKVMVTTGCFCSY